jgi:hypothetical protein
MPDQTVTGTDSTDAAATQPVGGTEAPTNDLPATGAATEPQPTPQALDEDFLKKLDALDPASLPQSFAEKYVPKAEFTRKTQAVAEERKRLDAERAAFFEVARRVIAEKPATPGGPSAQDIKQKELLDLAAAGDPQALQQAIDMAAEAKMNPIRTQVVLQNAAQEARAANPYVVQHWPDIIQTMQADPVIAQMATANNYAGASKVMIALGLEHQVRDMVPKFEALHKENESLKAKLATYERERTAGLPSSTTKAGTTAGRPVVGEPTRLEDVDLAAAWVAAGGRPEDFR